MNDLSFFIRINSCRGRCCSCARHQARKTQEAKSPRRQQFRCSQAVRTRTARRHRSHRSPLFHATVTPQKSAVSAKLTFLRNSPQLTFLRSTTSPHTLLSHTLVAIMIGQRLSIFVALTALLALCASLAEAAKLRTRQLHTTKEVRSHSSWLQI